MEKTLRTEKARALTRLLRRINDGTDPEVTRKEALELLPSIAPRDIALAEQNLIDAGYSARVVQQLSAAFVLMGILEGQIADFKPSLPAGHILLKVLAEHDLARCFLDDLKDVTEAIETMETMANTCTEFRKLTHIIEHLDSMEEHVEREEDIIFPLLKKQGWSSLCRAANSDHVYVRVATSDLIQLIGTFNKNSFAEFKVRLLSITDKLYPLMKEHLFQEDNILYPIAIDVLDSDVWDKIKALCDEIGYCGVHTSFYQLTHVAQHWLWRVTSQPLLIDCMPVSLAL